MTEAHWRLYDLLLRRGMRVAEGMNWLNEQGLISDQCIYFRDIALADVLQSINHLNYERSRTSLSNL